MRYKQKVFLGGFYGKDHQLTENLSHLQPPCCFVIVKESYKVSVVLPSAVAVVGIGCRFPGGISTLTELRSLLENKRDALGELPFERFDVTRYFSAEQTTPGALYAPRCGTVGDVRLFDGRFWGMSSKEAEGLDPQQRMILEMTWEAFEDAGIPPSKMAHSDTAVFIGAASADMAIVHSDDVGQNGPYTMTGTQLSIISNRISYSFNLHGPSMTVDTACSSSLVAITQAVECIRSGRAKAAVAGGVNVLLSPMGFVGFSKAHMLSPTGACRVFDAKADGYARSEGGAVVILKDLEQAQKDGDAIYAVIRAAAVNSDGRTTGIALPSQEAQAQLLRDVYESSETGLDKARVAYVEAHGTGTAVGDPVETSAIGSVLGHREASQAPLVIGSIKGNVGHLETGSGMAGFAKALLTLQNKTIYPNIHLDTPNPAIRFNELGLRVATEMEPLPSVPGLSLVGINSFGFGGTNAHVVLEARDAVLDAAKKEGSDFFVSQEQCLPLFLSAKSKESLQQLAHLWHDYLTNEFAALNDERTRRARFNVLAAAALQQREGLSHRAVLIGATTEGVLKALQDIAQERAAATQAVCAAVDRDAVSVVGDIPKTAFVFSGNGSQWVGMGSVLYRDNVVFQTAVDAVDEYFEPLAGYKLSSILTSPTDNGEAWSLDKTEVSQPLLFACQLGLLACLRQFGIKAQAFCGHSVGEVAAAYAAGLLTLPNAVRIIYQRSRLQGKTRGAGVMAAVHLREGLNALLQEHDRIAVAGINAPESLTVSGPQDAMTAFISAVKQKGGAAKQLALDYAFHSPAMETIHEDILRDLQDVESVAADRRDASRVFYSTVTGECLAENAVLDADYWWHNVRNPVLFESAIEAMLRDGVRRFVEVGPHAILVGYLRNIARAKSMDIQICALERRQEESAEHLTMQMAKAVAAGIALTPEWPVVPRERSLPRYPWNRTMTWLKATSETAALFAPQEVQTLLGRAVAQGRCTWINRVDTTSMQWLSGHKIDDTVLFPAAGFLETAISAGLKALEETLTEAKTKGKHETAELVNFSIMRGLPLAEHESHTMRTSVAEDGVLTIESHREGAFEPFTLLVKSRVRAADTSDLQAQTLDWRLTQTSEPIASKAFYDTLVSAGLNYAGAFQSVTDVWVTTASESGEGLATVIARLQCNQTLYAETHLGVKAKLNTQPPLVDAAMQSVFAAVVHLMRKESQKAALTQAYLPVFFGRVLMLPDVVPVWSRANIKRISAMTLTVDVALFDEQGKCVGLMQDLRLRRAPKSARLHPLAYKEIWQTQLERLPNFEKAEPIDSATDELTGLKLWDWQDAGQLAMVLIAAYAHDAVSRKGEWLPSELLFSGNNFTVNETAAKWLAQIMSDAGYAQTRDEAGETLYCAQEEAQYESDVIFRTLMATYPTYWTVWVRMQRIGKHLSALLANDMTLDAVRGEFPQMINDLGSATPSRLQAQKTLAATLQRLVEQITRQTTADARLEGLLYADNFENAENLISASGSAVHWTVAARSEKLARAKMLFEGKYRVQVIDSTQLPIQEFALVVVPDGCGRDRAVGATVQKLVSALLPKGYFLTLEENPNLIADFMEGMDAQWWSENSKGEPVSRLMDSQSWSVVCEQAHLRDVTSGLISEQTQELCQPYYLSVSQSTLTQEREQLQESEDNEHKAKIVLVVDPEQNSSLTLAGQLSQAADGSVELLCAAIGDEALPEIADLKRLEQSVADYAAAHPNVSVVSLLDCSDDAQKAPSMTLKLAQLFAEHSIGNAWTMVGFENKISARALLGFKRVAQNELPQLNLRWAELGDVSVESLRAFLSWVTQRPVQSEFLEFIENETEILIQAARKVVPTVCVHQARCVHPENPIELTFDVPGKLDRLYWKRVPSKALADDEVRIAVRATALNFRDVMWAMGLLPEEALENGFSGPTMGLEASGIVTEVGKHVVNVKPGDAVLAFAPACFASEVVTREDAVVKKPEVLSFEEAAGVPVAFFTAWYAMVEMGRARAGESILIHGAAGGVGLAAIQIAQSLGMTIYATAGTDLKRDLVRSMGVEHVYDSRSLAFVDAIRRDTNGVGVDLVLNSLAGNAAEQSLSLLSPFGRFLELGKRDFYADNPVFLRPFGRNLSYFGIDVDQLLTQKPRVAHQVFADVMKAFEAGTLTALPVTVFARREASRAFSLMQSAAHVGKIVVTMDETTAEVSETEPAEMSVTCDGTYVITGGLGGLGAAAARKLVSLGAKSLVLISRRGVTTSEQQTFVDELTAQGVSVVTPMLDMADAGFARALSQVVAGLPPVAGIIHAAGVIDDATLKDLTPERMQRVWDPKVLGALSLLRFVKDNALEDSISNFILFSSATALVGNIGQANYVAANMAYEGLIDALPAGKVTVIGWGPVGDVGMLKDRPKVKAALEATIGTPCLTSEEVVNAMSALAADSSVSSAHFMAIDWRRVQALPVMCSPRFNNVREKVSAEADAKNLKASLIGKSHDEVIGVLTRIVKEETARIMGMAEEELSVTQPLSDVGMDSLTVLELACALEERTGVRMNSAAGFSGANIRSVAERLANSLADDGSTDQNEVLIETLSQQHGVSLSEELKQAAMRA